MREGQNEETNRHRLLLSFNLERRNVREISRGGSLEKSERGKRTRKKGGVSGTTGKKGLSFNR